jgi:uncharacterized protein with von Willebrand factor type A (vWA) domain
MTTMDFANASKRVRKLLAPERPQDLQKSALTPDPLRDNIVREQEASSERFRRSIKKQPSIEYERTHEDGSTSEETFEWETYPEAVRDFARAAFGWDEPETVGLDKMRPSYRFNHAISQAMNHCEAMQELRPYSKNNIDEASYGAMAYADKLQELAAERCADIIDHSQQLSEQEERIKSADEMLEDLRNQARQENQEHGTVQPGTRKEIKGCLRAGEAARGKLGELMANGPANVSSRAGEIAREAAEEARDAVDAISGIPGLEPGQSQHMDPDARMALAERWQAAEGLRKMAREFGRKLPNFMFKRNARTKNVHIEPRGIESGDDFERLLPLELARGTAANKAMRAMFLSDLEDKALLQFRKEGEQPAGKGSIITCTDGSGSMGVPLASLTREGWAKVIDLVLLALCRREKRHFASVQFGSTNQLRSWEFPTNEPPDPEKVLDFATHFFGGGTDTETGMRAALRIFREQPEFKTADVVLIADGDDRFDAGDKSVRDELRDLNVRIHGVNVGSYSNPYLEQMCDHVVHIVDLANDEENVLTSLAENIT